MFLKLHDKFSLEFFFLNDNGMFFKEVKILVIRLLDLSIVGFEINGYGGVVWSPTKQTQNFWDWVGVPPKEIRAWVQEKIS